MASLIIGMSTRFETNPAASLTSTGVLPRSSASRRTVSYVSSLVASPRTTSTSFITGTGLKKCIPITRSGRSVAAAIWVIEMDDVFDARMALGGAASSSWSKMRALRSAFSVAASTTRSAAATPLTRSVSAVSRSSVAAWSSAVIRSLATIRPRFVSIVARAASRRSWSRSTSVTSWPAWAKTWAMPLPIVPAPMTARFMGGRGKGGRGKRVRAGDGRAGWSTAPLPLSSSPLPS